MLSFGIPFTLYGMQNATIEIADRVRGIAVEKRYTHDRIARLLDMSRTSVSARMNGTIPWTGAELLMLAAVFRVAPSRFFPDVAELVAFASDEIVSAVAS